MSERAARWVLRTPQSDAEARLFCLPYGGTGASALRRWPARIGPLEVCAVQLPGRENRIRHEPLRDFESFARATADGLSEYLDRPYAVFGHCMGALLAHALVVRLQQLGRPGPERLFVSSSRVPHLPPELRYRLPAPGRRGVYHPSLSDERLAEELGRVARTLGQGDLLPDLVPLAVRVLRRDLDLCFGYVPDSVRPVDCPITAIGWSDDEDVAPDEMRAWEPYGSVRHHTLPGDKLTFLTAPVPLLDVIERDFCSWR